MLRGTQETRKSCFCKTAMPAAVCLAADWARGESIIHRLESSTLAGSLTSTTTGLAMSSSTRISSPIWSLNTGSRGYTSLVHPTGLQVYGRALASGERQRCGIGPGASIGRPPSPTSLPHRYRRQPTSAHDRLGVSKHRRVGKCRFRLLGGEGVQLKAAVDDFDLTGDDVCGVTAPFQVTHQRTLPCTST